MKNEKKKKKQSLSEVCTINKERLIVLFSSYVMYKKYKRLVFTPSDSYPSFNTTVQNFPDKPLVAVTGVKVAN